MNNYRRLVNAGLTTIHVAWATVGVQANALADPVKRSTENFSAPAANDWPLVGGDWGNTRYSTLTQIDLHNVKRLGAAWTSKRFDEGGTSRVTPVVAQGLLFATAGRKVYALNARTGEAVWTYDTIQESWRFDTQTSDAKLTDIISKGVPNSRGVTVGQGLVFIGLMDGHVLALEQMSGRPVWIQQTGDGQQTRMQAVAAAPIYIDGVVLTGISNGDAHLRGRVTALDARSGKLLWQKSAIPGRGEPGHETWPDFNDTWRFGGAGVWTNAAVDQELKSVYFATGNAVPQFAGDQRPGDNLYTCSVLALDIRTGSLRWYYQLVHHDLFEGDVGTPVILYDARVGASTRKALAVLRADGYLFQLDRRTGQPLLPVKERPTPQLQSQRTSPTQPFPINGESILMSCDDWKAESIPAGFVLGCMWTPPADAFDPQNVLAPFPSVRLDPIAYSPLTGYFYAQGTSFLYWPRRAPDPYYFDANTQVPGLKAYREMAAIDSRTGRIAWRRRTDGAIPFQYSGGLLVTAGGLMFRSSPDGNVQAYDAKSGNLLWQFQTGMGGSSGAPSSYAVKGEQYIAIPMGPAVWAFKLGGDASDIKPPAVARQESEFKGPVVDTSEIETTSLKTLYFGAGTRYFIDEYSFNPYRARVTAGNKVLFSNNGNTHHEIVAVDGSWGTGPLSPTQEAWVTFDKPGSYHYICKDHPWVHGQIVVTTDATAEEAADAGAAGIGLRAQVTKGKEQFTKHCLMCHGGTASGPTAAPVLVGDTFMLHWESTALGDLVDKIRTTMPQASPGSLDKRTYLDIVAYLLDANGVTLGGTEITDSPESLKAHIRPHKDGG